MFESKRHLLTTFLLFLGVALIAVATAPGQVEVRTDDPAVSDSGDQPGVNLEPEKPTETPEKDPFTRVYCCQDQTCEDCTNDMILLTECCNSHRGYFYRTSLEGSCHRCENRPPDHQITAIPSVLTIDSTWKSGALCSRRD